MSENKWPGVIKRFAVRTGARDSVAMSIGKGYFLSDVKLAVEKR
jgi:hypothetical protein